jgi:hypothetical protein
LLLLNLVLLGTCCESKAIERLEDTLRTTGPVARTGARPTL